MSARPADKYLVEFAVNKAVGLAPANGRSKPLEQVVERPPVVDAAQLSEQAFARGVENGKALARLMFDSRLAEEVAKLQAQLACERDRWMQDEAAKFGQAMHAALGAIEQNVASATARILQPFVTKTLQRQAITELQEMLQLLLNRGSDLRVDIFGPQDLVHALVAGLHRKDAVVTCHESSQCDLRGELGQTVLETRLAAWLGKIEEAMA
jgi:hypothetical protein